MCVWFGLLAWCACSGGRKESEWVSDGRGRMDGWMDGCGTGTCRFGPVDGIGLVGKCRGRRSFTWGVWFCSWGNGLEWWAGYVRLEFSLECVG
ncbi:hypothetical protein IWX49DRAFT_582396 [Phyllosticta citricarpa]